MFEIIISAAVIGVIAAADQTVFNGKIKEASDKFDKIAQEIMETPKNIANFYNDRMN